MSDLMPIYHSCLGKIKIIWERTGVLLGHDEISTLCVPGETLILGDNKPVENITVGNTVLTQHGPGIVLGTSKRNFSGELFTISALGMLPIQVTPEHPVLSIPVRIRSVSGGKTQNGHYYVKEFGDFTWKKAAELRTYSRQVKERDYLVFPKINGNLDIDKLDLSSFCVKSKLTSEILANAKQMLSEGLLKKEVAKKLGIHRGTLNNWLFGNTKGFALSLPLDENTSKFMGLYVAEGHCHIAKNTARLVLSLHEDESDLQELVIAFAKKLNHGYYISKTRGEHGVQITITSSALARAFANWFGRGAANKRIPDFILLNKDLKILQSFLTGYLCGDGCNITSFDNRYDGTSNYENAVTSSKILALQIQMLYARLGKFVSIWRHKKAKEETILGRLVKTHDHYQISLNKDPKSHHWIDMDDYFLVPVKEVSQEKYEGSVYNLATTDHTYLVSNTVVHNCELWKTANANEFMDRLNNMSDDELRSWLEKLKKKRKVLSNYLDQEVKVYA